MAYEIRMSGYQGRDWKQPLAIAAVFGSGLAIGMVWHSGGGEQNGSLAPTPPSSLQASPSQGGQLKTQLQFNTLPISVPPAPSRSVSTEPQAPGAPDASKTIRAPLPSLPSPSRSANGNPVAGYEAPRPRTWSVTSSPVREPEPSVALPEGPSGQAALASQNQTDGFAVIADGVIEIQSPTETETGSAAQSTPAEDGQGSPALRLSRTDPQPGLASQSAPVVNDSQLAVDPNTVDDNQRIASSDPASDAAAGRGELAEEPIPDEVGSAYLSADGTRGETAKAAHDGEVVYDGTVEPRPLTTDPADQPIQQIAPPRSSQVQSPDNGAERSSEPPLDREDAGGQTASGEQASSFSPPDASIGRKGSIEFQIGSEIAGLVSVYLDAAGPSVRLASILDVLEARFDRAAFKRLRMSRHAQEIMTLEQLGDLGFDFRTDARRIVMGLTSENGHLRS